MKILKILIIVLALLIMGFFALGFTTPSVEYSSTITVEKPIEEAWAIMADETRVSEWLKDVKRMEPVSGTPNTVGAVANIYVDNNGEEMMMQETITKYDVPNIIAMTFTMDFMDMDYEMTLKEKNGKVEISSHSKTTGNGPIAKSIVAMMPSMMKAQEDTNMNNLKKVINENTKNYFSEAVLQSPE
jgi:uncharacterized protein YndB with AHSA1/START domain